MNKHVIPEPIVNAVASMLAPYRPGLTPQKLDEALNYSEDTPQPDRLLSRKEAMTEIHMSMPSIDRMLADKQLTRIKIRGRVFIRESEIRAIIEGKSCQAKGLVGTTSNGNSEHNNQNGGAE